MINPKKPTKIPGIPKPPPDASPGMRGWLSSVAEALEIRLGRRGDPKDRAVTLRELIDSGLAQDLKAAPFDPNNPNTSNIGFAPNTVIDSTVPPQPNNFSAAAAYSQVNLSWDYPNYSNHSFTEIYGHDSDAIGDAQLVGVSTGRVYIDPIGSGESRYYWIRHVSTSSVLGPWNSGTGTLATTAADVDHLLTTLSGAITSSELHSDLTTPINAVAGIQTDITDIENDITAIDTEISNLKSTPAWASGTAYVVGDLVSYSSNLYAALTAHTSSSSNAPDTTPQDSTEWKHIGAYGSIVDVLVQTETTKATLQSDYITTADSNSAIAAATSSLVSTTDLNTALGDYTTTANLEANYYTETEADSAIAAATSSLVSTTDLNTALGDYTTTANLEANYYTETEADSAISGAITTATSGFDDPNGGSSTVTLQQAMTTQATLNGTLKGQYTVKIDANGHVAGFGLANTTTSAGSSTSEFYVNADRFAILPNQASSQAPAWAGSTAYASGAVVSYSGGFYICKLGHTSAQQTAPTALYGSTYWSNAAISPFVVQSSGTTHSDGTYIPAGVYMNTAHIKYADITSAQIGSVNADTINAGLISADRIDGNSIKASKLQIDTNVLAEASNGDLILATGSATKGVKFENLSNDAVGVIAQVLQSGNKLLSNQAYDYDAFFISAPWSEYSYTEYDPMFGITTPVTITLPELGVQLYVPSSRIQETGNYYIDFGAQPFGSAPTNSSTSASMVVMIVEERTGSTGAFSYYASRVTNRTQNGSLPLTYRTGRAAVSLDKDKNYRFKLFGYIKGFNSADSTSGNHGMYGGFIRIIRIHKST